MNITDMLDIDPLFWGDERDFEETSYPLPTYWGLNGVIDQGFSGITTPGCTHGCGEAPPSRTKPKSDWYCSWA